MHTTSQSALLKTAPFSVAPGFGLAALLLLGLAAAPAAQAQTYTLNTLVNFDGSDGLTPNGDLILNGGTLYGTTSGDGAVHGGFSTSATVFSVPLAGGMPTTLASFNSSDGNGAGLGALTLIGNTLYGTTAYGGASGDGTVFSVPVGGGAPTTLASFDGSSGEHPSGGLKLIGNTLYGTASFGGPGGFGTVFSVPVSGGAPTTLASFNGSNGGLPQTGLTLSADGSIFYGTTYDGTVFSVPVSGGAPTTLASFSPDSRNGDGPNGGLTLLGSTLYGTATYGGADYSGTVFSVPVGGGTLTTLASFNDNNGRFPEGGLTLSTDSSTLYGTTYFGGEDDAGTVFSVPVGGGALTDIFSFDGDYGYSGLSGSNPVGELTLIGSTLYGTTTTGGVYGGGTVFALTPNAAPVPEASSFISFGLLLLGGLGGVVLRARKRSAVG